MAGSSISELSLRMTFLLLGAALSILCALIADSLPLWFTTAWLIGLIVFAIVVTIRFSMEESAKIVSLPDIAFITGAFVYFVHPALASLYSGYEPASTMVLQQLMVIGVLCGFFTVRLRGRWRRWRTITSQVKFSVSRSQIRVLFFLFLLFLPWVVIAVFRLSDIVTVEYGERSPGQRNANTIPLLGLDYFGYIITALCVCAMTFVRHRLAWVVTLIPLALGGLQFLATSTRTAVLLGDVLSIGLALLRFRSSKWLPWVMLSAFFVLLPLFDVIGRVRHGLPSWDAGQISQLAAETFQLSYSEMVENNEAVTMSQHADVIIEHFSNPPLLGYYIFFCLIQSPPAMILKHFGLEDVRALSAEYVRAFYPGLYESGGNYALSISAEAYCNFGIFGGVILGVLAATFFGFLEAMVMRLCSAPLAYVILTAYSINLAKLHRNGVEMMPKPIFVIAVLCSIFFIISSAISFLRQKTRSAVSHAPSIRYS